MAIVSSQLKNEAEAIQTLEELTRDKELSRYHLLPATLGILNLKIKNHQKARHYLGEAKKMTKSKQEIDFLNRKLNDCQT